MRRPAMAVVCALLAACSGNDGSDREEAPVENSEPGAASVVWHTFWDVVGGEPDAEELAPSARFEGAGIGFEHPKLLRRSVSRDDDGDPTWSFEHGMFELQLLAPSGELRGADYLGLLGSLFEGGRSVDAEAPGPGRTETICGHRITATRLRIKLMGDWSEQQAFDLPAPPGESRVLIFDDEPIDGKPSAVAAATWERVLGSLRCDPAFVHTPPDSDAEEAP
jgi:hypothetical protein